MVGGMLSSAECRVRATVARATATRNTDEGLRDHFDSMASSWLALAVTAHAQEVMEANLIGRENNPALPTKRL
jgi:hypothetical protein